jgi:hypothetical protein
MFFKNVNQVYINKDIKHSDKFHLKHLHEAVKEYVKNNKDTPCWNIFKLQGKKTVYVYELKCNGSLRYLRNE